jgi:hypothetical protein
MSVKISINAGANDALTADQLTLPLTKPETIPVITGISAPINEDTHAFHMLLIIFIFKN